jgi:hypothetical protein
MAAVLRFVKEVAVALLRAAVGFHEYGNNGNPYSKWQYGVEYPGGGWCCSFASYISYMAGFRFGSDAQYGDKGFGSTNVAQPWAQKHGLWRDRNWRAAPGDWVIFNWDGGGTDHVEVVIYDDGIQIITIGGNTGNAVASRVRDRSHVAGFVALSASPQAKPVLDADAIAFIKKGLAWVKAVTKTPLNLGDSGPEVTFLNQVLAAHGLLGDSRYMNIFTKATRDALVHARKILGSAEKRGDRLGGPGAQDLLNFKRAA